MASQLTNLDNLNNHLLTRSYIEGFNFSNADVNVFSGLAGLPDRFEYPHAYRWYVHIAALRGIRSLPTAATSAPATAAPATSNKAPAASAAPASSPKSPKSPKNKGKKAEPAKPAKAADDDFELNFDDEEPAAEEKKAAPQSRAEKIAELKTKKEKKVEIERSQFLFEVKPVDTEVNLDELFRLITSNQINGLTWGEGYEKRDVAFGIQKLVMSCVVVNDLVCEADLTEPIEALEEFVQSVDVLSMNRL